MKLGEADMTTITVTKRSGDYHARMHARNGSWGCGSTMAEAIGSALLSSARWAETSVSGNDPVVVQRLELELNYPQ